MNIEFDKNVVEQDLARLKNLSIKCLNSVDVKYELRDNKGRTANESERVVNNFYEMEKSLYYMINKAIEVVEATRDEYLKVEVANKVIINSIFEHDGGGR